MPRRNANASPCSPCGSGSPAWREWEPDVECWSHGPSTRRARRRSTLNEERPPLGAEVALPYPEVLIIGARRVFNRTA